MTFFVFGYPYLEWAHFSIAERDARVPDWNERRGAKVNMTNEMMPDETEATEARTSAERALLALRALEVTGDNMEVVGSILVDVKKRLKGLEERLKEITAPIRAAEKSARDLFRPAIAALEESEGILKRKIGDAQRAIVEANRRAMEQTQQALALGDSRGAALAASSLAPSAPPAGVATREVITFTITDPDAVPRYLCSPDERKIRAVITACGTKEPISGVTFGTETQVSVRTK